MHAWFASILVLVGYFHHQRELGPNWMPQNISLFSLSSLFYKRKLCRYVRQISYTLGYFHERSICFKTHFKNIHIVYYHNTTKMTSQNNHHLSLDWMNTKVSVSKVKFCERTWYDIAFHLNKIKWIWFLQ